MTKIGLIDMDDTLYDFAGTLRKDLEKTLSPQEKLPDNLWDNTPSWLSERMKLIKSQPGWWLNLPNLVPPLGRWVYDIAVEIGFKMHILTKGPYQNPLGWAEKHQRISQDFGNNVVFNAVGEDKSGYYGRFLVDDYGPYLDGWLKHRPRGLGILIDRPHNQNYNHENVICIRHREDLTIIREKLQAVFDRESGQHWK